MRALLPWMIAPLVLVAGCGQEREIYVDGGWVRLAAVPGRPAAAYFTLHGGPVDDHLLSARSGVAIKSEMHESMSSDGMAGMKPIAGVDVPAGGKVVFAPGGKHVMLFQLNPGIKPGSKVPFTFTFASGLRIEYAMPAVAAGEAGAK